MRNIIQDINLENLEILEKRKKIGVYGFKYQDKYYAFRLAKPEDLVMGTKTTTI